MYRAASVWSALLAAGGSMGFPPVTRRCAVRPKVLAVSIEPADSTVMVGEAVTFVAVQSSNYGNFSYQWRARPTPVLTMLTSPGRWAAATGCPA